jgi:hypothetical protein
MSVAEVLLGGGRWLDDQPRSHEQVLGRAGALRPDRPDRAPADDESVRAALLMAGYTPGAMIGLSQRYADVSADLADEQEKCARFTRRQEHAQREHAAGRLPALAMAQMIADGPDGDENKVRQLQHRADSLRSQLQQAAEVSAPSTQRGALSAVEEASARALAIQDDVARWRREEDEADVAATSALRKERGSFRSRLASLAGSR